LYGKKSKELDLAYARDSDSFLFLPANVLWRVNPPKIFGGQAPRYSKRLNPPGGTQWRSQKPFKPCAEFCNFIAGHDTRKIKHGGIRQDKFNSILGVLDNSQKRYRPL
jgi:hypothetical protein